MTPLKTFVVACRFCPKSFQIYHGVEKPLLQLDVFEEVLTVLPGKWLKKIRLFVSIAIAVRFVLDAAVLNIV